MKYDQIDLTQSNEIPKGETIIKAALIGILLSATDFLIPRRQYSSEPFSHVNKNKKIYGWKKNMKNTRVALIKRIRIYEIVFYIVFFRVNICII